MVSLDKIYHASYVLRDVIRNTELIRAPKIRTDCEVFLKPECLQVTGSFKVRGSGYMISQRRYRLQRRKPCPRRGACRNQVWDKIHYLPAGRRAYF